MRFSLLLEQPVLRGALVLLAAVASVATSSTSTPITAEAGARRTSVGPGATVFRIVSADASADFSLTSQLPTASPSPGTRVTLTLRATDATDDVCLPVVVTFAPSSRGEGRWTRTAPVPSASGADAGLLVDDDWQQAPSVLVTCRDVGARHVFRAAITNEGTTPIEVDWQLTAQLVGVGNEADEAFVNVRDENP